MNVVYVRVGGLIRRLGPRGRIPISLNKFLWKL